jgi:hypothetical protein
MCSVEAMMLSVRKSIVVDWTSPEWGGGKGSRQDHTHLTKALAPQWLAATPLLRVMDVGFCASHESTSPVPRHLGPAGAAIT